MSELGQKPRLWVVIVTRPTAEGLDHLLRVQDPTGWADRSRVLHGLNNRLLEKGRELVQVRQ